MNSATKAGQGGGITLGDIYYVLFRRKWIIIFFALLAVAGAIAVCIMRPPRYRSTASLFIRYVVEGTTLTRPGDESDARPLNIHEAGILDTEGQILRSLDVVRQAAEAVGPEVILSPLGGGTDLDAAASAVLQYLKVQLPSSGSVITITYEHPDSDAARQVLQQVIFAYIKKHKEMHRPEEIFGGFVSREATRLRESLNETERALKEAKIKAGVVSLEDARQAYAEQRREIRGDLFEAQAQLAEHEAALGEATNLLSTAPPTTNSEPRVPLELVAEYRNICARLDLFSRNEQELLTHFTEDSTPVRDFQEQIAETKRLKKKLEDLYPSLSGWIMPATSLAGQPAGASIDPAMEAIRVRALKSKIDVLNVQLAQIESEQSKVAEMEDVIGELQRKKEMLEADLRYFSGSMEQSRVEAALGVGKAPNIGIVQSPSPPVKGWSKPFMKKLMLLVFGCVAAGFVLAFVIELYLDRSVKRPVDVLGKLGLSLFISIPDIRRNGRWPLIEGPAEGEPQAASGEDEGAGLGAKGESASRSVTPPALFWDSNNPLCRFYEGLRDRLIVHFDSRNLTQKPKLVAVTSCGKKAGVTTIAAGLAAALSETGDGNVLLVDLNAQHGASQPFYRGKPGCALEDALASETRKGALVQSNLYVVAEGPEDDRVPSVLSRRFTTLIPKLKASQYDYIIFDMPPVSQTSITPRLARLMDTVLFVVESGKTSQDMVQQAMALLQESKASVGVVLNKSRTYVPRRLHQDTLEG